MNLIDQPILRPFFRESFSQIIALKYFVNAFTICNHIKCHAEQYFKKNKRFWRNMCAEFILINMLQDHKLKFCCQLIAIYIFLSSY